MNINGPLRRRVTIEHDRKYPETPDSNRWITVGYESNGLFVHEDTLCIGTIDDCTMCATLFLSHMRGF